MPLRCLAPCLKLQSGSWTPGQPLDRSGFGLFDNLTPIGSKTFHFAKRQVTSASFDTDKTKSHLQTLKIRYQTPQKSRETFSLLSPCGHSLVFLWGPSPIESLNFSLTYFLLMAGGEAQRQLLQDSSRPSHPTEHRNENKTNAHPELTGELERQFGGGLGSYGP